MNIVAPGQRACPCHFRRAQEEAFVILEGRGADLSISTKDTPEVVEQRDSGKYLASATRDGNAYGFARMHRTKDDLDDFDGEP